MRRTNIQCIPTPTKWVGRSYYDPEIYEAAQAGAGFVSGALVTVTVATGPFDDSENVASAALASGLLQAVAVDLAPPADPADTGAALASGALETVVIAGSPTVDLAATSAALVSGALVDVVTDGPAQEEPYNSTGAALVSGALS